MLQMLWDGLAPLAFIALCIGAMLTWRYWPKVRRVQQVLRRLPSEINAEIQAAWNNQPSPREILATPASELHTSTPPNTIAAVIPDNTALSTSMEKVQGGGRAMLYPPSLQTTLDYMKQWEPDGRYMFPYGWFVQERSHGTTPDLAFTDLAETFNIGVIGPSQYGKTSLIFAGIMALTFQRSPRELQFAIFDLKDIDFSQMEDSAYTHLMIRRSDQITQAVKDLQAEIERRGEFLRQMKLTNWRNYRGKDLPMLVVYISELSAIVAALGNTAAVDKFLNDLMGKGAAFGIRTIVDTHSLSGYGTLWRNLLNDRLLGPGLSNPQQDQVNGDLPTAAIIAAGAVPPSQLRKTHRGVFTITTDAGQALTVRMVYVTDAIRQAWLDRLPRKLMTIEEQQVFDNDTEPTVTEEHAPNILAGRAAALYRDGVELGVILAQPQVREELRELALTVRHTKTDMPNVRQITIRLFEVEAPSGTQQPMVSNTLMEMGLLTKEKTPIDAPNIEQSTPAMAA